MGSYVFARLIGAGLVGGGGWWVGQLTGEAPWLPGSLSRGIIGAVVGVLLGGLLTPYITVAPARGILRTLQGASASRVVTGALGLVIGLVFAVLVSTPLARIPGWPGIWIPVALSILFAVAGVLVMLSRERDLFQFLPQNGRPSQAGARANGQIVVDTSAIIDGRIADISQTGFVIGTLIIPPLCAG